MTHLTEETLEQTTLAWFENLGYNIEYGPDIAFDGSRPERDAEANYSDVILAGCLREALERINSDLPFEAIDEAIVNLRPDWHGDDDTRGTIKVVMSGSASDELSWQPHIRTKKAREAMAKRFKDPGNELKLVIVRDMWLTGFDCPSMHTMYVDKPMGGHNLMQAIARVNRVFRDKPGGLVVDYLGLADALNPDVPNMGLTSWCGSIVRKQDVAIAKNYLNADEIKDLNEIVTMYLDYAERQARQRKTVTISSLLFYLRL